MDAAAAVAETVDDDGGAAADHDNRDSMIEGAGVGRVVSRRATGTAWLAALLPRRAPACDASGGTAPTAAAVVVVVVVGAAVPDGPVAPDGRLYPAAARAAACICAARNCCCWYCAGVSCGCWGCCCNCCWGGTITVDGAAAATAEGPVEYGDGKGGGTCTVGDGALKRDAMAEKSLPLGLPAADM